MCNKVCIVKNGILIEQGSIAELQKKYLMHYTMYLDTNDNREAGDLIGQMETTRSVKKCAKGRLEVKLKKELSEKEIIAAKHRIVQQLTENGFTIEEMSRKVLGMEDIFFRATAEGGDGQ